MFNENGVSKYVAVLLKYKKVAQISMWSYIFIESVLMSRS